MLAAPSHTDGKRAVSRGRGATQHPPSYLTLACAVAIGDAGQRRAGWPAGDQPATVREAATTGEETEYLPIAGIASNRRSTCSSRKFGRFLASKDIEQLEGEALCSCTCRTADPSLGF